MKAVYKYELPKPSFEEFKLWLPEGAVIIDLNKQEDKFYAWALVDVNENAKELFKLVLVGTGWEAISWDSSHIKSMHDHDGFVWHLLRVEVKWVSHINANHQKGRGQK